MGKRKGWGLFDASKEEVNSNKERELADEKFIKLAEENIHIRKELENEIRRETAEDRFPIKSNTSENESTNKENPMKNQREQVVNESQENSDKKLNANLNKDQSTTNRKWIAFLSLTIFVCVCYYISCQFFGYCLKTSLTEGEIIKYTDSSNAVNESNELKYLDFNKIEGCSKKTRQYEIKVISTSLHSEGKAIHKIYVRDYKHQKITSFDVSTDLMGNSDYRFDFRCFNIDNNIIVGDYNFDGAEDIAVVSSSYVFFNGYEFYINNSSNQFEKDEYLSMKLEGFPEFDPITQTAVSEFAKFSGKYIKKTHKLNTNTNQWKLISEICTNCETLTEF